ncbi:FUSC family protein [Acetobacter farinalis]|uniref:FUSC family protein n=1 Tax=Acetobacter farinalis TaxID=1260984 RepID=A0ABT3Q898_9PROT|nr:FUSC family protein [Acetobacter farinalis]MCX2561466.1 FUSC family protein [Acetobacter farinalis]
MFSAPWLGNPVARQTIRLLVSVGLCGCVTWITHLQEPGWALITSVIVTQSSITETLSSGRYQLVGTLIGAAASILPITLMLYHWPLWQAFVVAFVPLAVLASWRPGTRMSVVTLMIATLFTTPNDPYLLPIERVLSILIGVGVSMLVTYVVLHEQARRDAFRNAALTVRQIVGMLTHAGRQDMDWSQIQDLNDACVLSLRKVQTAVEEARREHWRPLEQRDPMLAQLPKVLRQLQMDTLVVARAVLRGETRPVPDAAQASGVEPLSPGLMRGFDWIISRCEGEAVARTGEEYRVAAGVMAGLSDEAAQADEIMHFVVGILQTDLKALIHLLGQDDTAQA